MRRLDEIFLSRMRVNCIVGIYPGERGTPQPIEVELSLFFERTPAAQGLVDYARVFGDVSFLLESCRFRTLESAAEALCRYLLAPPPLEASAAHVEAVALALQKPDALKGVAQAGLRVRRRRRDYSYASQAQPFGTVESLHAQDGVTILRVNVRAGQRYEAQGGAALLALGGGFEAQGKSIARGAAHQWAAASSHYVNTASSARALLVVPSTPTAALSRKHYYPPEDAALGDEG